MMSTEQNNTPLSIARLKEMGFVIPKRPFHQKRGLALYGKVNRIIVKKLWGFLPITKKCPPIAVAIINNRETFLVYTPFPKTVTNIQEILEYCNMK